MKVKCAMCQVELKNISGLSHHIRNKHSLNSKQYYDQFIKTNNAGSCVICNKPTSWKSLSDGYKTTCSHSCGGVLHRQHLKLDVIKYKKFTDTVAKNTKNIWSLREGNEQKQQISNKISKTLKKRANKMTTEQRRKTFGWLNKYTGVDRQREIDKLLKTGIHAWWKNCTQEQREYVHLTRRGEYRHWLQKNKTTLTAHEHTRVEIRQMFNKYITDLLAKKQLRFDNYLQYRKEVDRLSNITYTRYKNIINPENLKRSTHSYHLDHKVSVYEGFMYNIPPDIISSVWNLQMLSAKDNYTKSLYSSITVHQLLTEFNQKKHDIAITI
jgi:hypothetical protein